MNVADFFSMFILGLLGTGHCIGMCGPLVFAFPGSTGRFSAHLWYHTGRLGAYTFGGAFLGGFGAGLVGIAGTGIFSSPMGLVLWIQFGLSLIAAIFMLIFGLAKFGLLHEPEWMNVASPERLPGLGRFLRYVLTSPRNPTLLVLGGLMGFIPCGLSYAAFVRALPSGGAGIGALLLLSFGLGTLPGLLLLGTGFSKLFRRNQNSMNMLAGLVMIAMAVRMMIKSLPAIFQF
jgi:sulfite exporter TauE/SafE